VGSGRVSFAQRWQRERDRVRLSAAPAGSPSEELGAGGADDEDRHTGRPVDEVIDEVEESFVSPVEVLEDEYERSLLCERLHEAPPRGEALGARVRSPAPALAEAEERSQVVDDPSGLGRVLNRRRDSGAQLFVGG
jgi:hypothetical protein